VTTEIEDETFFQLFKGTYPSVFAARIMRLPDGTSKQFAFVRFHDEAEYEEALKHQTRISMQLGCQIRISKAHPRPPLSRRFPAGHSRPISAASDVTDPSAKYHMSQALIPVNMDQQRMPQSSPSSQSQPFLPSDPVPVYYIPVPGYPYHDPSLWPAQWPDFYQAAVSLPEMPQHMYAPEAGDTDNMHHSHSFPRPAAWQQVHLQQHIVPDQRFLFNNAMDVTSDVPDASVKTDHFAVSLISPFSRSCYSSFIA
jgi:hypothetical protein